MQDRFDGAAHFLVGEQPPAQLRAIEPAVRAEDSAAERLHQRRERRLARFDDFTRDAVGVDHDRAGIREEFRNGRLAARDAAGEADAEHRINEDRRC